MKICYKTIAIAVLIFFQCAPVIALADLDAKQAILSSWQNFPTVIKATQDLATSQSMTSAAKWQRFPTLNASAGKTSNSLNTSSDTPVTLSISQPIYTGGKITSGIESAYAGEKGAEFGISEAKWGLADNILKLLSTYTVSLNRVEESKLNVRENERLVKLVRARVEGEVSPELDLRIAQSRLDSARSQLLDYEQQVQQAKQALNVYTATVSEYQAVEPSRLISMETGDLDTLNAEAENRSPTLLHKNTEVQSAEADVGSAKSAIMPSVIARLDRSLNSTNGIPSSTQVGVYIQFQPDAGLASLSKIQSYESKVDSAKSQYDVAKQQLFLDIQQTLNDLVFAQKRLPYLENTAVIAKKGVSSFLRQYEAGRRGWLELLNQQREAYDAKMSYLQVREKILALSWHLAVITGRFENELQLDGYEASK